MSITFWDPRAPISREWDTCCCVSYSADGKASSGCLDCHGSGFVVFEQHEGEFTLANDNARALLELAGEPPEYSGRWCTERMVDVQRAILLSLNVEQLRNNYTRKSAWYGNIFVRGRDHAYLREALQTLSRLVANAHARGSDVCWG